MPPHTSSSSRWSIRIPSFLPLIAAFMWFATLWALLITWLAQGRPHYVSESDGQTVAYISDVAADILKPLFIVGCSFTGVGFFLSLTAERWARHAGRLLPNMRTREKVFSALAIIWSFIGGAGLILLSIFDTKRFENLHRVFLLVFVAGTAFSAIFTILEYRWLNKDYGRRYNHLRRTYIFKFVFAAVLIVLAIAFGSLLDSTAHQNSAAIIEWTISFLFTFYLLSFYFDLKGSRTHNRTDGENGVMTEPAMRGRVRAGARR